MKKPVLFITTIISIIIVLSVVQVAVANRISTTGIALNTMQKELQAYSKENTILHTQVLQAAALTTISEKAVAMGFDESGKKVFLSTPLPLARR